MTRDPRVDVGPLQPEAVGDAALVERLAELVNGVYAVAERGLWRDGATRTTSGELAEMLRNGKLVVAQRNGRVVGSVRVHDVADDVSEFGLLVAAHNERGRGVGRALLDFAEARSRERGVRAMQLELLVPRSGSHPSKEFLRAWYGRRGYRHRRTSSMDAAYPQLAPLLATPCDLEIHEKELQPAAGPAAGRLEDREADAVTKVYFDISMSLDGYVTASGQTREEPMGPGGDRLVAWAFGEDERDRQILADGVGATGAVIAGWRTYNTSLPWWGADGPTGEARVPVFVVTHAPPADAPAGGVYTFVTDGIEAALAQARTAAGDKHVTVMGGADTGRQYLRAGLIDELSIHLVPVLLGGGTRMFEHIAEQHIQLERVAVTDTPAATHLRLRVVK